MHYREEVLVFERSCHALLVVELLINAMLALVRVFKDSDRYPVVFWQAVEQLDPNA